jgi:hypothetical protein
MSPGIFRLCLRSLGRAGNMVVEGRVAQRMGGERGLPPLLQAIEFGFAFCPSHLPWIVAECESWTAVDSG